MIPDSAWFSTYCTTDRLKWIKSSSQCVLQVPLPPKNLLSVHSTNLWPPFCIHFPLREVSRALESLFRNLPAELEAWARASLIKVIRRCIDSCFWCLYDSCVFGGVLGSGGLRGFSRAKFQNVSNFFSFFFYQNAARTRSDLGTTS